jgi:hypothetical protein
MLWVVFRYDTRAKCLKLTYDSWQIVYLTQLDAKTAVRIDFSLVGFTNQSSVLLHLGSHVCRCIGLSAHHRKRPVVSVCSSCLRKLSSVDSESDLPETVV